MSLVLTLHNVTEKKNLIKYKVRFQCQSEVGLSDLQGGPQKNKSKTREKSRQTQNRRTIEPRRCQKAIVRFGLNLKKKTTIKPYENFKLGSPTNPLEKH